MIKRLSIIAADPQQAPAQQAPAQQAPAQDNSDQTRKILNVLDPLLKNLDAGIRGLNLSGSSFKELKQIYPDINQTIDTAQINKSIQYLKGVFQSLQNWKLQMRQQFEEAGKAQ